MTEHAPKKIVDAIVEILDDHKGSNITVLDVSELTTITNYFVICSGRSTRHVSSLADKVIEGMKAQSYPPNHVEGKSTQNWVLVDFDDVMVHIMLPETREYYKLEDLWSM